MAKKIFVVDDEKNIRDIVRSYLEKEGFNVSVFENGESALEEYLRSAPDMLVIDIMMPGMSGLELCNEIRKHANTPIIIVSARDEEIDRILGIEMGADDYMTKPFSPSELVARVDAIYRRVALAEMRTENNFKEEIHSGEFSLNLRNRYLLKRGQPIELTQVEFQIMEYFFSNPATALDRTDILKHVWGESYFGEEKIVDVNIRRLRMKVEDEPSNPKHIVTVWGLGYKWEA